MKGLVWLLVHRWRSATGDKVNIIIIIVINCQIMHFIHNYFHKEKIDFIKPPSFLMMMMMKVQKVVKI